MTKQQLQLLVILIKLSRKNKFAYQDLMKLYIRENNLENVDFF